MANNWMLCSPMYSSNTWYFYCKCRIYSERFCGPVLFESSNENSNLSILRKHLSTFQLVKNKRAIIYILGIISTFIMIWSVQTYITAIPPIRAYFLSGADITSTLIPLLFLFLF